MQITLFTSPKADTKLKIVFDGMLEFMHVDTNLGVEVYQHKIFFKDPLLAQILWGLRDSFIENKQLFWFSCNGKTFKDLCCVTQVHRTLHDDEYLYYVEFNSYRAEPMDIIKSRLHQDI